jgi:undecaprenyl-diphosphatase
MTLVLRVRQFIESRDHRLMRRVNRWSAPQWVRLWMIAATRGGDGWFWYSLALVVVLFGDADRFRAVGSAGLAAGTGVALFIFLKRIAARRRPCQLEPHCWATLLPPDQFSFPSGHTITAFSVAVAVGHFYPSLSPALLFIAVSVGISRIVLGMHFLSDVLAGAALGALLGQLATAIVS